MKLTKPNVEFFIEKEFRDAFLKPKSSSKFFPEWFKTLPPQVTSDPRSSTVKRCIPFLDACSSGFIIPMWCDVFVKAENGDLTINFPENFPINSLGKHEPEQIKGYPLEKNPYGTMPLKWLNPWGIKTPKGYSCLFTSPLNHFETRFKLVDGIVDTDTYYNKVNFPFLWTGGDGEFLISKGTPLVQVIPFKRDTFQCSFADLDKEKHSKQLNIMGTMFNNIYKKLFWHKRRDAD